MTDLRPDLRDRVDAIENAALLYNGTAHDYQRGLGNRQDAAREELMALVESLARDLQRAEAGRAECAQLLLLRETEIEEGDAAYRIVADQLAECRLARQCADRDLATARAECEKADGFGTRAELARLKLAGDLATAHDYIRRTHAALGVPRCDGYGANLGEQTLVNAQNLVAEMAALRARLAQAREALRKWAVHPEECAALDYDPPRVDSVRLVQIIRGSGLDFRAGDAAKCDCGLAPLLTEEDK